MHVGRCRARIPSPGNASRPPRCKGRKENRSGIRWESPPTPMRSSSRHGNRRKGIGGQANFGQGNVATIAKRGARRHLPPASEMPGHVINCPPDVPTIRRAGRVAPRSSRQPTLRTIHHAAAPSAPALAAVLPVVSQALSFSVESTPRRQFAVPLPPRPKVENGDIQLCPLEQD